MLLSLKNELSAVVRLLRQQRQLFCFLSDDRGNAARFVEPALFSSRSAEKVGGQSERSRVRFLPRAIII